MAWVGSHCGSSFFIEGGGGGGGGGGGPPTPFIERRFGPAPLGLHSGPMYMSFSTPLVAPQLLTKASLGKG